MVFFTVQLGCLFWRRAFPLRYRWLWTGSRTIRCQFVNCGSDEVREAPKAPAGALRWQSTELLLRYAKRNHSGFSFRHCNVRSGTGLLRLHRLTVFLGAERPLNDRPSTSITISRFKAIDENAGRCFFGCNTGVPRHSRFGGKLPPFKSQSGTL